MSPVHLPPASIGGDYEVGRACSTELRGQYIEAAHAAKLEAEYVTHHLSRDDAHPQAGERAGAKTDNQLAKIIDPDPSLDQKDRSFPAFWLPFQDVNAHNHTAQWVERVVAGGDGRIVE